LPYALALDLQRAVQERVIAGDDGPTVLLVEHDPVITQTAKKSAQANLIASPELLASHGITLHETDRGGDITYHGPGQLVAYPILKLADFDLNLSRYMRLLEQSVIDTAGHWQIEADREQGATGVWVTIDGGTETAKLCALGVRIRKNTTMHGLALNVTTDLNHFKHIIPCGLVGRPVTSMAKLLGDACPSMEEVKKVLIAALLDNLKAAADAMAE